MNTCQLLLLSLSLTVTAPLQVEQSSFALGEVHATKPLTHTVQLTNTSATPLTITEVVGSCGCIRRDVKTKELAGGGKTTLTLGFNLLAVPEGKNTWRVTVRYAQGDQRGEQTITVTANVVKDVSVEPVALFLTTEKETTATLVVKDRRGKPLTVKRVRCGIQEVQGTIDAPQGTPRSQQVTIRVPESTPTGAHSDEVCLDTDDPDCPELRIPIRVVKKSATANVEALPAQPSVRFAVEQPSGSVLVRLRDSTGKEVQIERIEVEHEAISTKWAPGPGSMATLRVTLDRAKLAASGSTIVTIHLRRPREETVLVPLSWTLP